MPINDDLPTPPPGGRRQCRRYHAALPSRVIDESDQKQIMRLSKTEWIWVGVAVASIACFGNWLQAEMNRAALDRSQRETQGETQDMRGTCAGMSAHDTQMMDKGELWCGTIGSGRADSLGKL